MTMPSSLQSGISFCGGFSIKILIPLWFILGISGKVLLPIYLGVESLPIWQWLVVSLELLLLFFVLVCHTQIYRHVVGLVSSTLLIFFAFSFVSFALGNDSCGCFGPLRIPPLFVVAIDYGLLIAVVLPCVFNLQADFVNESKFNILQILIVFLSALVSCTIAVVWLTNQEYRVPATLKTNQNFPWFDDIKNGDMLENEPRLVMFSNSTCQKCLMAEKQFKHMFSHQERIIVDVGSVETQTSSINRNEDILILHVKDPNQWLLSKPILVSLRKNIVEKIEEFDAKTH